MTQKPAESAPAASDAPEVVSEQPSVFDGQPPVRAHADGSQSYGPYSSTPTEQVGRRAWSFAELLRTLRESPTAIDPRDPRLAEIEQRLERARASGAGQSTNGRRILSILDGDPS